MLLESEERGDVRIIRVKEAKLTYPILSAFFAEVRRFVEAGTRRLVLDLSAVGYVDSASIGCLMDIHRLLRDKDGMLTISGLQPRVETFQDAINTALGVASRPARRRRACPIRPVRWPPSCRRR